MNKSGKTLTIFLFIISFLMIAITVISVFFFLKEVDLRKSAESNLEQLRQVESKLQGELKETKQQLFLYEEKQKEAEQKIESLMEDLELEQGLREEIKKENRELKDAVEKETKAREELNAQMSQSVAAAEEKAASLQKELDGAVERNQEVEQRRQELEAQYQKLKAKLESLGISEAQVLNPDSSSLDPSGGVSLDKIVVAPGVEMKGSIVNIDTEANFLIVKFGQKDGIKKGTLLSIYRGDEYLGDVRVSRVLPEMSAADFIPPLTSRLVNKDDRVSIKQ